MDKKLDLYGIFGHPLAHTLSPVFQEAGMQKAGLLAHYLVFDFSEPVFKKTMRLLKKIPLKGFNLTVPYKQTVIPYLDWLTDSARAIGAVNTVYRFGKKWYGTNTDAEGFWLSLKKEWNWKPKGKSVLVIGAGGAARAVVYALASRGARTIAVSNRTESRAQDLIAAFKKLFPKTEFFSTSLASKKDLTAFDLIVNTTSAGLKKNDPLILPAKLIPSAREGKKYFVDLIYNPAETPFLKAARQKGHKTLNGLSMLLYQGARAFEIWTGKKAPIETMRSALIQTLKDSKK
ncbi:MAG TPA: shikimate dehydrogenase [Candidatus Omnitrophota bacterium]|nr:shikimate dehydrogenase [Candidatus Omnitrophota bacterium]HRK60948.1 shikimate dehydrogenase [Candidatus Omnitrophota bacterium]